MARFCRVESGDRRPDEGNHARSLETNSISHRESSSTRVL